MVAATGLAACQGLGGKPHPLYFTPEDVRPESEIALLYGPVHWVDGNDVSQKGQSFALAPGCHVVQVSNRIGQMSPTAGWSVSLSPVVYAFRMEAGRSYVIDHVVEGGEPNGTFSIRAWEKYGSDKKLLSPVATDTAIQDCRNWSPAASR